ncbi:MAG: FKBP-type peptidyl-prolyl cis-trans isomerase [Bacteroidota bacterium]
MKKILGSVLVLFFLLLNSCGKTDTGCQPVAVSSEKSTLVAYCTLNNITYTEDPSGLLYQIITPGTGANPTTANTVSVVYTGRLMDNTIFTQVANSQDLRLSDVIDGWKIGIALLKKGGHIKLVIPSALAYSCTGRLPTIPGNAPLFFDITLNDIK